MAGLNTSNAVVAFEKMEQKVLGMEAQVRRHASADNDVNPETQVSGGREHCTGGRIVGAGARGVAQLRAWAWGIRSHQLIQRESTTPVMQAGTFRRRVGLGGLGLLMLDDGDVGSAKGCTGRRLVPVRHERKDGRSAEQ